MKFDTTPVKQQRRQMTHVLLIQCSSVQTRDVNTREIWIPEPELNFPGPVGPRYQVTSSAIVWPSMVSRHTTCMSSAKCALRGGMVNTTHSLTHCMGWRYVPAQVKRGFQLAYGTVPVRRWIHVDVRSTYVNVLHRKSTQDTADANYVTYRCCQWAQLRCHPSSYDDAVCVNAAVKTWCGLRQIRGMCCILPCLHKPCIKSCVYCVACVRLETTL